eukprot:2916977-Alexandrium_andersonii.AAC.1
MPETACDHAGGASRRFRIVPRGLGLFRAASAGLGVVLKQFGARQKPVSYTHLRAHETSAHL